MMKRKAYKIDNETIEIQQKDGNNKIKIVKYNGDGIDIIHRRTYKEYVLKKAYDIYLNKDTPYNKILRYAVINDELPNENTNKILYRYIKDKVLAYNNSNLSDDRITKLSGIPYWNWEYINLSNKGLKYTNVLIKVKNGLDLDKDDMRTIKKMKYEYDLNMMDSYYKGSYIMILKKLY